MNDKTQKALQPEPQLIDLGDAKELTQGPPSPIHIEENPILMERK